MNLSHLHPSDPAYVPNERTVRFTDDADRVWKARFVDDEPPFCELLCVGRDGKPFWSDMYDVLPATAIADLDRQAHAALRVLNEEEFA